MQHLEVTTHAKGLLVANADATKQCPPQMAPENRDSEISFKDVEESTIVRAFETSVWEVSVFMGTTCLTSFTSAFLCATMILTLLAQSIYIVVGFTVFSADWFKTECVKHGKMAS